MTEHTTDIGEGSEHLGLIEHAICSLWVQQLLDWKPWMLHDQLLIHNAKGYTK